jgi:hypothetical protein
VSWWEALRSPQEKMPQREAFRAGDSIATRFADAKSVRLKRMRQGFDSCNPDLENADCSPSDNPAITQSSPTMDLIMMPIFERCWLG